MEAIINSYRHGRKTQNPDQVILVTASSKNREAAHKLVGKKVTFTTESGKKMVGEVRAAHGNKGAVRVMFDTGMPGQCIGQKATIE
jgi:large subunit ribosomal protein L35Ae